MPVAVIYIVMDCAQQSILPFALFNSILLRPVVTTSGEGKVGNKAVRGLVLIISKLFWFEVTQGIH